MYEPVLNLNGFSSGSVTGKTIVPHEARAALDMRIPYGTDVESVVAGSSVSSRGLPPRWQSRGCNSVRRPERPRTPRSRAPWSSPSATWGRRRRCGLRLPGGRLSTSSNRSSELPFASGGAGHAGRAHAADEYATIAGLRTHMRQSIAFLYRFARAAGADGESAGGDWARQTRRHTVWTEPLEFGKLTWPEVARAAGEGRVPIVPIGTLEDHGYHLPIDTDVTLVEAVCRGAAERLPARRCSCRP